MGNCVSFHKNTDMKLAVQIQSLNKENTVKSCRDTRQTSEMEQVASFRNPNSKDEIFFDSHLWLDSDCEDYFSVNGDLTPSRGSTPVHQTSFIEAPQLDKIHHMSSAPDFLSPSSPTDMKKQLIELFRESFNDDPAGGNKNLQSQRETKPTILDCPPKSTSRSPYVLQPKSLSSCETTPYGGSHNRKENSAESTQCCIPSFMRNMSFTERKKRLSPSNTNGWSLYMKRNTEHDPPYWRGPIWMNMNYSILSALYHYTQVNGPYRDRAKVIYDELMGNLIRNVVATPSRLGSCGNSTIKRWQG